jgi:futalosine hydrolase
MMRILSLFSSDLERSAAFPDGVPSEALIDVTGVGPIDAAIGTVRAIERHRPDAVVFIGTCGAHRDAGLAIGDVVLATTIRLGSGDVARGEMRIPSLLPSEVSCDDALSAAVAAALARDANITATAARVSCTLGVTETDELARTLAAHDGSQVENLEAFSVAHASRPLPVAVVLGVTNFVGSGGGRDWLANYAALMLRLSHCVAGSRQEHSTEHLTRS